MGKKHIIQKTEKELLEERETVDAKVQKEVKIESSLGKAIKEGKVYISSSYNNTIITLTDLQGRVLAWTSAGRIGFKGAKKATPFAASKVAEALSQTIQKLGIKTIAILVKGIGSGRESAIQSAIPFGIQTGFQERLESPDESAFEQLFQIERQLPSPG